MLVISTKLKLFLHSYLTILDAFSCMMYACSIFDFVLFIYLFYKQWDPNKIVTAEFFRSENVSVSLFSPSTIIQELIESTKANNKIIILLAEIADNEEFNNAQNLIFKQMKILFSNVIDVISIKDNNSINFNLQLVRYIINE